MTPCEKLCCDNLRYDNMLERDVCDQRFPEPEGCPLIEEQRRKVAEEKKKQEQQKIKNHETGTELEAVALVEPVYYIIYGDIKINAEYFKRFLNNMLPYDNTVFDINDPEEAAILDLIKKEKEKAEVNGPIGYVDKQNGIVRIGKFSHYDEIIKTLISKIDMAIEKVKEANS